MDQELVNINSQNARQITFGCCISINLANYNDCYITSDGYINSKLQLKSYKDNESSNNFSLSVFKILPFSTSSTFASQNEIHTITKKITEKQENVDDANKNQSDLKIRKKEINSLKNNLDVEINMNISLHQKLKGTPVLFEASVFQLVHVATLKYLCLNDENPDNLFFNLVDYPNNNTFFKFMPSLKLQKQRNNLVYDQDLVIICSNTEIHKRFPTLYTNFGISGRSQNDNLNTRILASMDEEKKQWKINLYQFEQEENEKEDESNFLKFGDVIWLQLSERNYYLSVTLNNDPFEKRIIQQLKKREEQARENEEDLQDEIEKGNENEGNGGTINGGTANTEDHYITKTNENELSIDQSFTKIKGEDFMEDEIIRNYVLEFQEFGTKKKLEQNISSEELTSNGLWRVEHEDFYKGGMVEWENLCRFKHLTSGRFLKVRQIEGGNPVIELSAEVDPDCLFSIVPIKNLLKNDINQKYIAKDAYFRLRHQETKSWLSLTKDLLDDGTKETGNEKGKNNSKSIPVVSIISYEIDTFKMRKADFEQIWETSFLLSAFPILVDVQKYLYSLPDRLLTKKDLIKQRNFEEVLEKVLNCLDYIEDFAFNKINGNIAINQEFSQISPVRQRILREQNILGLLCWLLCEGFPKESELYKLAEKGFDSQEFRRDKILNIATTHVLLTGFNMQNKKRRDKMELDHIKKKYLLSYRIYNLIKIICESNKENQEYVFKFCEKFIEHLGYGDFISQTLIQLMNNNEKLLYELHKSMFRKNDDNAVIDKGRYLFDNMDEKESYLLNIVKRIQSFESYEKPEILELLTSICKIKDQGIFMNQDKVFKFIYEDSIFRQSHLMNFSLKGNTIIVTSKTCDTDLVNFIERINLKGYEDKKDEYLSQAEKEFIKQKISKEKYFLKKQLELFSTLCLNRNYVCSGAFGKIFTLPVCIEYALNENFNEDFRAIFINLIARIHIDKEPRTIIEKPNLVRTMQQQANQNETEQNELDMINIEVPKNSEQELLKQLKGFIINYLNAQLQFIKENKDPFTKLTYEIVKLTGLMLKFDLFESQVPKKKQDANLLDFLHANEAEVESDLEVERLIKVLGPMLEYDSDYFFSLNKEGIERVADAKEENNQNIFFNAMGGLQDGLGNFVSKFKGMIKQDVQILSKKENKKKAAKLENENETIKEQIFKKAQALKKILNKFSNKTYTIKKEDDPDNYEVPIKVQICDIFEYIFDMRQEFLIDNVIEYYQKLPDNESAVNSKLNQDLSKLLPDEVLQAGYKIDQINSQFENFSHFQEFRSFDKILKKSFIEIIMFAFYFTNNSSLQNALLQLVHRYCTEKARLRESILKLEILFSEEDQILNYDMSTMLLKLKNLISKSQIWLQIVEKALYQPGYLDLMNKAYKKLLKLEDTFKKDFQNKEKLGKKQRIFKHIGGHKTIVQLINKGLVIFETYMDAFFNDGQTMNLKYKEDIAETIVEIFRCCTSILGYFCHGNKEYQGILYTKLNLLMQYEYVDIGQIQLMSEIFKNNRKLCDDVPEKLLVYFPKVIKIHGQKQIFLSVFETLISFGDDQHIGEIKKKVLMTLLKASHFDYVIPIFLRHSDMTFNNNQAPIENSNYGMNSNPNVFSEDPDEFAYTSKFLQILAKCLKDDVGVNLIAKCYKRFKVKLLLTHLQQNLRQEIYMLNEVEGAKTSGRIQNIENAKQAIIEILLVFFSNSTKTIEEFMENNKLMLEIIQLESQRLSKPNTYTDSFKIYFVEYFIPIFELYYDNFEKDPMLMNLKDNSSESKVVEIINEFGKLINGNVDQLTYGIELNIIQVKNLIELFKTLEIEIPEDIQEFNRKYEVELEEHESDNENQSIMKGKTKGNKISSTIINGLLKPGTLLKSGKNMITKIIGGNDNTNAYTKLNEQIDPKTPKNWDLLKKKFDVLEKDSVVRKAIKNDIKVLSDSIMNFIDVFPRTREREKLDLYITNEDLIVKILNYLEYWIQKNAEKTTVIFMLRCLGKIIKNIIKYQDLKDKTVKEEIQRRQNLFDSLNATKIALVLIWDEREDDYIYLYELFKFTIILLYGGNKSIQKTIYEFFISSASSEKFFRKINNLLLREIMKAENSAKFNEEDDKAKVNFTSSILKLLQLFCEGHNIDLQNYIRQQTNSKNNYDLITLTAKLVCAFKINRSNFETVCQGLETMTEAIQGPCKFNQLAIVNSKFLEFAEGVLSDDQKVVEIQISSSEARKQKLSRAHQYTINQSIRKSIRKKGDNRIHPHHGSHNGSTINLMDSHKKPESRVMINDTKNAGDNQISSVDGMNRPMSYEKSLTKKGMSAPENRSRRSAGSNNGRKNRFQISLHKIAILKYKVSITLVSLLEANELTPSLALRIMRAIHMQVLIKNLVEIHGLYKEKSKKNQYDFDLFDHYNFDPGSNSKMDDHEKECDGFILENGFNIFILINIFIDHSKKRGLEENEELDEFMKEEENINKDKSVFKKGVIGAIIKLLSSLMAEGFNILKKSAGAVADVGDMIHKGLKKGVDVEEEEKIKIYKDMEFKQKTREAISFFSENIKHIEIMRDEQLVKIYFPMLPYCKTLSKSYKKEFQEKVNRSSTKTKLADLMKNSDYIIKVMKHEQNLIKLFNAYKLIGIIANNGEFWEYACFYTNIALNVIIISSYSSNFTDRLNDPHLFFNPQIKNTKYLITTLGIVNLVFSALVVGFTLIQRGPLLVKNIWRGFRKLKMNFVMRFIKIIFNIIWSIYYCFTDFLFSYYLLFICVAILGLVVHPFFFVIQLYDLLRIELLTNVIKAVWIPKVQIFLTFIVFLLFEYYFALIGYMIFPNHYNDGNRCASLWECYFTTFDWTFKADGAVGGILVDPELYIGMNNEGEVNKIEGKMNIKRFLFDNGFKIIMVLIIINMVAGIIIDTFGALKEALQKKSEDINEICFVCGLEREKLDKSSERKHGFAYHIQHDHYMWNYVFYKAYLNYKKETEHNGDETYIRNKIEGKDLGWFPINRALVVKNDESIDELKSDIIREIQRNMNDIKDVYGMQLQKINQLSEQFMLA